VPSNVNPHCFPPPRTIEEHAESFNVKDATGRTSALRGCPLSGNCGYRLRFERDGSVATVEGFGCRPIATMRLAPGPASESLQ